MTKHHTLIILTLVFSLAALARGPQAKSKFKLDLGAGLQTIFFSSSEIENKASIGANYNLGYEYYLTKEWSFATGFGIGQYHCNTTINATNAYPIEDEILGNYELRLKLQNIHELLNSLKATIPLGFKYTFGQNKRHHSKSSPFATSLTSGIVINLPVSSRYETKSGTVNSVGYFEELNLEIADEPQYGFYAKEINQQKGNTKLNPSYGLFGQFEMSTNRYRQFNYYIAAYGQYGLSNILSDKTSYKPITENNSKSILNQKMFQGNLLAFGLKLGLILGTN